MQLVDQETPIIAKTRELCEAIVAQESFAALMEQTNSFFGDEEAQNLYEQVLNLQETLQTKQQSGQMLGEDEIRGFEEQRDKLMAHPVASGFLDAQGQIQAAQQKVIQYVTRTFELGRVPTEEDFASCGGGSCGSGCGCG